MYDGGKIGAGLAVFVGLVTAPIRYGLASGRSGERPALERAITGDKCVESAEHMRAWHMTMLDSWRNAVVRSDERIYVASDGRRHDMSLSGFTRPDAGSEGARSRKPSESCLGCHTEPAKFCDRCHDYVGVNPYCWDCHDRPAR